MRSIIALLLITLTFSTPVLRKETGVSAAVEAFFQEIGYNEFDNFIRKTIVDGTEIKALLDVIWDEYKKSPLTWVNVAQTLSKTGKAINILALNIKENANNTALNQQFEKAVNNLNIVLKDTGLFGKKVFANIENNSLTLTWALYDLKNLWTLGDYVELGKRSGTVFKTIFDNTVNQTKLNLRSLGKFERFDMKSLKMLECPRRVFELVMEMYKAISSQCNLEEVFQIISEIYRVVTDCMK
jgi:hypothetical protein